MYNREKDEKGEEGEVKKIVSYIKAGHPLFYIQHPDFFAMREIIKELKKEFADRKFYEYTNAFGSDAWDSEIFDKDDDSQITEEPNLIKSEDDEADFETEDEGIDSDESDSYDSEDCENGDSLSDWLAGKFEDENPKFLVLKDIITEELTPASISYIKEMAEKAMLIGNKTVIIIAESKSVPFPKELESLITLIDIKPLCDDDIKFTIRKFVKENDVKCSFIDNEKLLDEFAYSFRGLQQTQIDQILGMSVIKSKNYVLERNQKDFDQKDLVLKEKEQLIKKSGTLEIINDSSDFKKIGGLENLKRWLEDKKVIYEDTYSAKEFGVAIPKGILIAGMPGCGKSLAAKATANLFNVPLVRLDIGSLLGSYIGESEANMRKALSLSESFSPCVLWLDELEKAFAGISAGSKSEGSEVVTRLFGQFLTWMQEKKNEVFIVATANDINSLPPELLRKGRFDELFFVDLPNKKEREDIFKIKFESKNTSSKERKWDLSEISFEKLAEMTDGCSGSDIEDIVNTAIEKKYIESKRNGSASAKLSTDFILEIKRNKKSITEMLGGKSEKTEDKPEKPKNKIEELRQRYKELNLIPASD